MNLRMLLAIKEARLSLLMVQRIALFLLLVALSACGRKEEAARGAGGKAAAPLEAREVRVLPATAREIERTVPANGALAAHDQTGLSVKAPGRLAEISVDIGARVKKGDLIAAIEKRDYELRVQQSLAFLGAARARLGLSFEGTDDAIDTAQTSLVKEAAAQLDEQRRNRERTKRLRAENIIADADVEAAEAAFLVAQNRYEEAISEANNRRGVLAQRRAELNIAQQLLADTQIRAPFDGVIQDRRASPGDFLSEGSIVATLVRIDPIRLRLQASEREALQIQVGQPVRFRIDGDTNFFAGKVDRVSPSINETNRMLALEADIRNADGRLRPGAFVRGEIVVTQNASAVMAPREAVITFAGIEKVFVMENGKAAERRITTGRIYGNEVEVLRGLKAGESVVLNSSGLRGGQPLTVEGERKARIASGT
jgi:RND family efflux transporter MFP subunit